MTILTSDDVKNTARLARIAIDDGKITEYADNMSKILTFAEQMNQVNTDNITPLAHPLNLAQRLREDKVTETNQRNAFQDIAPLAKDGLYLVPKVID